MNFNLTDEQTLLQQTVRQFAEEVVAPGAVERDEIKTWPEDIISQLGGMGLMEIFKMSAEEGIPTNVASDRLAENRIRSVAKFKTCYTSTPRRVFRRG